MYSLIFFLSVALLRNVFWLSICSASLSILRFSNSNLSLLFLS